MYYGRALIVCQYCELKIVGHPRCPNCDILLHPREAKARCSHKECHKQHTLTVDGIHCQDHTIHTQPLGASATVD